MPLSLSFRRFLPLAAVLALAGLAGAAETSRRWTNTTGQSFDGTFVSATAEKVTIVRADGKTFDVEKSKLSTDDLTYVDLVAAAPASLPTPVKPPAGSVNFSYPFLKQVLRGYNGSNPNFNSPWPTDIGVDAEPEITTIEENAAERRFVYESPHFHFQSTVLLRPSLLAKVAMMFEATYKAHHDLPLNNRRTRSDKADKLKAFLYETHEEYLKAGGMPESVGVYMPNGDKFMVALDNLGVKKVGSGYMFDYKGDFHTMYHEITHQLWADLGNYAGTWMVEGFAEFVACAPYSVGKFSFSKQPKCAIEYATAYGKKNTGGRALGTDIAFPHLSEIMSWDQPAFYTQMNRNYGMGLLLVYYFVLMDGEGDKLGENFKKCIQACQDGKSEEDARKVLLAGRSYEDLEKDFASAWKKKGIKITYN